MTDKDKALWAYKIELPAGVDALSFVRAGILSELLPDCRQCVCNPDYVRGSGKEKYLFVIGGKALTFLDDEKYRQKFNGRMSVVIGRVSLDGVSQPVKYTITISPDNNGSHSAKILVFEEGHAQPFKRHTKQILKLLVESE